MTGVIEPERVLRHVLSVLRAVGGDDVHLSSHEELMAQIRQEWAREDMKAAHNEEASDATITK